MALQVQASITLFSFPVLLAAIAVASVQVITDHFNCEVVRLFLSYSFTEFDSVLGYQVPVLVIRAQSSLRLMGTLLSYEVDLG